MITAPCAICGCPPGDEIHTPGNELESSRGSHTYLPKQPEPVPTTRVGYVTWAAEQPELRIQRLDAEVAALREALAKAHLCPTVRNDGTCDGCFISAALAKGTP